MYLIMVQKENKIPQKQSTAKESLDYIWEMVVLCGLWAMDKYNGTYRAANTEWTA